jgi:DMSO reductase anchor subunit
LRRNEWQLVIFTILVQLSVGSFTLWGAAVLLSSVPYPFSDPGFSKSLLVVILAALTIGVLTAMTHLSKPKRANFTLANLTNSWLSREALLGGLFGLVVSILAIQIWIGTEIETIDRILIAAGTLFGLLLVYTISRLYMLRTVPVWNNPGTPVAFFLSSFILGLSVLLTGIALMKVEGEETSLRSFLAVGSLAIFILVASQLIIATIITLVFQFKESSGNEGHNYFVTDLKLLFVGRWITALLGLIGLYFLWPSYSAHRGLWLIALTLVCLSEVIGRVIFYRQYRRVGY